MHYVEQALKAQVLFQEGRDYIRQRDRIVLVDEFTGRLMPDRRLSDGLHQALEAKHGLTVRSRMVTQATITIQNYFRMYPKLAGMTGTALSEAEELHKIYNLDVTRHPHPQTDDPSGQVRRHLSHASKPRRRPSWTRSKTPTTAASPSSWAPRPWIAPKS